VSVAASALTPEFGVHVDIVVGRRQGEIGAFRTKFDLYPWGEANTIVGQVLPHILLAWSLVVLGSKSMPALVLKWDLFPFSSATALPLLVLLTIPDLPPFIISAKDLVVKIGNRDHRDKNTRLKTQKLGDNPLGLREAFKPSNLFASHST